MFVYFVNPVPYINIHFWVYTQSIISIIIALFFSE